MFMRRSPMGDDVGPGGLRGLVGYPYWQEPFGAVPGIKKGAISGGNTGYGAFLYRAGLNARWRLADYQFFTVLMASLMSL